MNRGVVLRNNLIENVKVLEKPELGYPALNCVYYDDELSGQTLVNNTFRNCYAGLLLGGGRDNQIIGNTFINMTSYAITFDARGLGWQKDFCFYNKSDPSASGELVTDLFARHYNVPPYSTAYPTLPGLLSDRPCTPVGNVISGNSFCNAAKGFLDVTPAQASAWGSTVENNIEKC